MGAEDRRNETSPRPVRPGAIAIQNYSNSYRRAGAASTSAHCRVPLGASIAGGGGGWPAIQQIITTRRRRPGASLGSGE
jgi:hypothetical protein